MSNIDTRKALELARDALHHGGIMQTHKAIDAIDAALSAPAAPVATAGNELARFLAMDEAAGFKSIHDVPGLIDALRAAAPAAPVELGDPVRELASSLLDELDGLIGESSGVYGLHLNGDPSPWDELTEGGQFERLTSMEALRSALAAPSPAPASQPVSEPSPAAHLQGGMDNDELRSEWCRKLPGVTPTDSWLAAFAIGVEVGDERARAVLALRPAVKAQPLTDEQIDALTWGPHEGNSVTFAEGLRDFARAIERAHGIGQGGAA